MKQNPCETRLRHYLLSGLFSFDSTFSNGRKFYIGLYVTRGQFTIIFIFSRRYGLLRPALLVLGLAIRHGVRNRQLFFVLQLPSITSTITVSDSNLQRTEQFNYFGLMLSANGNCAIKLLRCNCYR